MTVKILAMEGGGFQEDNAALKPSSKKLFKKKDTNSTMDLFSTVIRVLEFFQCSCKTVLWLNEGVMEEWLKNDDNYCNM